MKDFRSKLKNLGADVRHTFTGVFVRDGFKNGFYGATPTVLLKDIRLSGQKKVLSDHLWFNKTKGFASLDLKEGDKIQFDARVSEYIKGYFGDDISIMLDRPQKVDYKLSHPTKIKKIAE